MKAFQQSIIFAFFMIISILLFNTTYDDSSGSFKLENLIHVLSFEDSTHSFRELSVVLGMAAFGMLSLVFLVGPLAWLWPHIFSQLLIYRKRFAFIGVVFAVLHGIYFLSNFYDFSSNIISLLAVIAGAIALIIFILVNHSSIRIPKTVQDYKYWKLIHKFGYLALFFAIVHVFLVHFDPVNGFNIRPYALLFLIGAIMILLLRFIAPHLESLLKNKHQPI